MMMLHTAPQFVVYWLSEQPAIVNFRWSHSQSWGSTWSFLFISVALYIIASAILHRLLCLVLHPRRKVPLGPIPALHSLATATISAIIFIGILLAAAAEIRDTRWLWRRTKTTPFEWFLCFPLGTRPSGRVFFWSYAFYLSRFLHLFRTFFSVLGRRFAARQLLNQAVFLVMSFLWLEYSQSFQVIAIIFATTSYCMVYGYRFWTAVGLPSACFSLVVHFQLLLLCCNIACHVGGLCLHMVRGGCNGIGAWVVNSVLNAAICLLFLKCYAKTRRKKSDAAVALIAPKPGQITFG